MAKAFVKTFKRDYVHANHLDSAKVVLEQFPGWIKNYNENAPHKDLKMKSPREHRKSLAVSEQCPVK